MIFCLRLLATAQPLVPDPASPRRLDQSAPSSQTSGLFIMESVSFQIVQQLPKALARASDGFLEGGIENASS